MLEFMFLTQISQGLISDMGVLFQAIHPVEYSRTIPQAMAEELIQQGGLGNLLCILFTDDPGGRLPKYEIARQRDSGHY